MLVSGAESNGGRALNREGKSLDTTQPAPPSPAAKSGIKSGENWASRNFSKNRKFAKPKNAVQQWEMVQSRWGLRQRVDWKA